jgi:outer membrane lipoprotein carrier protein
MLRGWAPSSITDAMLATLALLATLSAAPDPAAVAQRVQAYYDGTRDFTARFEQTYTYAAFGRTQASAGTLEVKRPGKLRWDYVSPAQKTIALSGQRLVQYEPEANQAYVDEHFDAATLSAGVTFLWGKGSLTKEFELALDPDGALRLTPKRADGRVQSVTLTVKPDGEVTSTRVVDGSGNTNALVFKDMKRNVGLADAEFDPKLPKDVHYVKLPGTK